MKQRRSFKKSQSLFWHILRDFVRSGWAMVWGFWRDFIPAPAKKVIRIVLGVVLVVIGTVGLVLPGIQGIATILIGLVLLSKDVPFAKRIIAWLHTKWDEYKVKRQAAKQNEIENSTDGTD